MHPILTFHHIGQAPADAGRHRGLYVPLHEFRAHLGALRAMGRRSLTPEEDDGALAGAKASEPRVWITFDDGHLDNYTEAFPALVDAGMVATIFVVADRVLGGAGGYMTPAMLRELAGAGMAVASHSLSHPHLARVGAEQLRAEVRDSKARLEDALGHPVRAFCYPYGNFSPAVLEEVKRAGYNLAASTIRDNRNGEAHRFALRRIMVMPGKRPSWLRYAMSPVYHWLHARKNARRWGGR